MSGEDFKARLAASKARLQQPIGHSGAPPATIPQPPPAPPEPQQRKRKQLPAPQVEKSPDIHKTPPHSPEAEMGVLGSIMVESQFGKTTTAIETAASQLRPWHFFVPACKTIFEMMIAQFKESQPIELIGFTQLLRDRNLLDAVGGAPFVTSLISFVPTGSFIQHYIEIVLEQFRRREMIALGTRMVHASYGAFSEDALDLMKTFEARMTHMIEGSEPPAFVDATSMLNGELPALPRLVASRLLHQGDKMIIGGSSKARKTWALIAFALACATGTDWWGFRCYKSRVCYINLELHPAWFARRLKALCEATGVTLEEGQLKVLNLRGHIVKIESLRRQITPLLKANRSELGIIDPIYKVLGDRDENSAGDIAALLNEIEKITVDTGAAMAFAAHFSKGNQALKEFMDRIGGSGVFARDPDAVMTMTQHEESDCFTVETRLRNIMSPSAFVVRWDYPSFVRDDEKNPEQLKGKQGAPSQFSEKDILDEMSVTNGWKVRQLQQHVRRETGMSEATFYRFWRPMKKAGKKVRQDDEGLWYRGTLESTSESTESSESKVPSEPF